MRFLNLLCVCLFTTNVIQCSVEHQRKDIITECMLLTHYYYWIYPENEMCVYNEYKFYRFYIPNRQVYVSMHEKYLSRAPNFIVGTYLFCRSRFYDRFLRSVVPDWVALPKPCDAS